MSYSRCYIRNIAQDCAHLPCLVNSRPVFGVGRERRLLWCTQAYHESPITYTRWYERFQYRCVSYWRCYIRNTPETGNFPCSQAFETTCRCSASTQSVMVHTSVSRVVYYIYKLVRMVPVSVGAVLVMLHTQHSGNWRCLVV